MAKMDNDTTYPPTAAPLPDTLRLFGYKAGSADAGTKVAPTAIGRELLVSASQTAAQTTVSASVTQIEAEAGTETANRWWSPLRVFQSAMAKIESLYGVANGIPRLNASGQLVGPLIPRSGTKAEIDAIVLSLGEVAYYTDTDGFSTGDGTTAGGFPEIRVDLGANVEAASNTFVDVVTLDMTGYSTNSIWEVGAFAKIQSANTGLIDPHNFRLKLLPETAYASVGGGYNTYTGNHGLNTITYQNSDADAGLGGEEIVFLAARLLLPVNTTAKLQLAQVTTAAGKPMYAVAGSTYLRVKRIA